MFPWGVFYQPGVAIRLLACVILAAVLTACAVVKADHVSVPAALVANASVPDFETARAWADEISPAFFETPNRLDLGFVDLGQGRLASCA